jgi:hypothetical protein
MLGKTKCRNTFTVISGAEKQQEYMAHEIAAIGEPINKELYMLLLH